MSVRAAPIQINTSILQVLGRGRTGFKVLPLDFLANNTTLTEQGNNVSETITHQSESYRVTAEELRQFVERYERLNAEKKDIGDQQKEVMAEAKSRGYDTRVLRKLIAIRTRDRDDLAEEEAVLEMYRQALGM